MKPNLILFDGTDGSGKTTSLESIEQMIIDSGKTVVKFNFPGYSDLGKVTRPFFLENNKTEFTKLFLILGEFSVFLEDFKNGDFDEFDYVLCDRFVLSTTHQCVDSKQYVSVVRDFVEHWGIDKITYFLLITDIKLSRNRLYGRGLITEGDKKAIREAEKTCFATHAKDVGIAENLITVTNDGTRKELIEKLTLHFKAIS